MAYSYYILSYFADAVKNKSRDMCQLEVTNHTYSMGNLYLKLPKKACNKQKFDKYVIVYSSMSDYREVLVPKNKSVVVIKGLREKPESVTVEAVTASESVIGFEVSKDVPSPEFGVDSNRSPTVTTTTTVSNNGLLISVIILSILFVSSAVVATYLCVYLRV